MGNQLLMLAGDESVNPLVPTGWEVAVLMAGAVVVMLFIGALISIGRNRNYTPAGRVFWLLIVLALPVLGPILWFLIGRTALSKEQSIPS
jgi:hypothetical protein